ncbi:thioredoxin-like protein [Cantharellus anzutake]|uniref:thioredoxin-like protein n=1 Tax=Cantharellus anzutake TaxID=1750568 RepID=UPI0019089239|nr:thioredoxin-like protein [Cantharellus anzutake]KAF8324902.1 thioredoxin-like protein [Cantharellus anzutake]
MPPRKLSGDTAPAEGTRRSSRIASNPTPVAAAAASKARKPSTKGKSEGTATKKKRTAKEEDEEASAKKKAKTDAEDEDQIEDDGSGEGETADGKELQVGDILPDITLKNEKGDDIKVNDLTSAEQGVVFFLVPKADTPGCTTQACLFRDSYSEFNQVSYAVYCVSADTPQAQQKWQTKKELPYPLLSDPKRTFIRALGSLKPPKSTARSHFIFEKGSGKLIDKKSSVKPAESAKLALEFIKKHHGTVAGDVMSTEPKDAEEEQAAETQEREEKEERAESTTEEKSPVENGKNPEDNDDTIMADS